MKKLYYKNCLIVMGLIITLIFIGSMCVNRYLFQSKQELVDRFEQIFQKKVSLENLSYKFPDKIVLKNLSVYDKDKSPDESIFTSSHSELDFSVLRLIISRNLVFKDIVVNKIEFAPFPFFNFVSFNLMEYLKHMSRHDLNVKIEQATYRWSKQLPASTLQAQVHIKNDIVKCRGSIRESISEKNNRTNKKDAPFVFDLKGSLADEGFTLTQMIINQKYFYSKFWGHFVDDLLWINGFCLTKKADTFSIDSGVTQFWANVQNYMFRREKKLFKYDHIKKAEAFLSDIGILAQINKEGIDIKRFFINSGGVDVVVTGEVSARNQEYALRIEADLEKSKSYSGKIEKIVSKVNGDFKEAILNNNAVINLYLKSGEEEIKEMSQLDIDVKNLKLNFLSYPYCFFGFQHGTVKYKHLPVDISIPLRKTAGFMNFDQSGAPQGQLQTYLYNGSVNMQVGVDLLNEPHMTTRLKLKNISLSELTENLFNLSVLKGYIDSDVIIQSSPELNATGQIKLKKAKLINERFMKQVANHLQFSSGETIAIDKVSTGVVYDGKRVKLTDIRLDVNDLKLRGSLVLKEDISVNSQFSLYLTRRFIQNSKLLRSSLSFLGPQDPVKFDFKVSGYANAPNFQWVDSETKKQIQTRLPDFIERMVDDHIQRSFD